MTTHDYYSIPLRFGLLILILSCAAIINMLLHFGDCMDDATYKCVFAIWAFIGLIACDISKNGLRQLGHQRTNLPFIGAKWLRFRKRRDEWAGPASRYQD